jgi:hypothetical protein
MAHTKLAERSGRTEGGGLVAGAGRARAAQPGGARQFARPASAPAYYLGRPARVWLARFRPHFPEPRRQSG